MSKTKTVRTVKRTALATSHGEASASLVAEQNEQHIGPSEYYSVQLDWPTEVGPAEAREFFRMAAAMLEDAERYEAMMRPPLMNGRVIR